MSSRITEQFAAFLHGETSGAYFHFAPAYLFTPPVREFVCESMEDVSVFFSHIESALRDGYHLAGYVDYELGRAFEMPTLEKHSGPQTRLAWMGVFDAPKKVPEECFRRVTGATPDWPPYWLEPSTSLSTRQSYHRQVAAIQRRIAAGETYQVNLTFPLLSRLHGCSGNLFADLYHRQPVGYAAMVRNREQTILSLSPELFFSRKGDRILVRPMKGTAPRGQDPIQDEKLSARLLQSKKNRAENLMIVDLLRNDLGRICRTRSVRTERLFQIEKYRTLFQMTSTVSGELLNGISWEQIFRSLFPSGSVTGAPKIRTMQIIQQIEDRTRGVYTGAIGYLSPGKRAVFNIPIRTLTVENRTGTARLGIGSGIVSDSRAAAEWRECHLKAAFFKALEQDHQLIETMRWDPGTGLHDKQLHLQRLKKSAGFFRIPYDRIMIAGKVGRFEGTLRGGRPLRIRLLLDLRGNIRLEKTVLPDPVDAGHLPRVCFSEKRTDSRNIFLQHKTTHRAFYENAWMAAKAKGCLDILFFNEQGHATEGAITNLFIRKGDVWYTPPLHDGLLPGIMRGKILRSKRLSVREKSLTRRALLEADEIRLSNSVRGFFPVILEGKR